MQPQFSITACTFWWHCLLNNPMGDIASMQQQPPIVSSMPKGNSPPSPHKVATAPRLYYNNVYPTPPGTANSPTFQHLSEFKCGSFPIELMGNTQCQNPYDCLCNPSRMEHWPPSWSQASTASSVSLKDAPDAPFSNRSLQNHKWNPAGCRQPVAHSSSFLGALKIIITPPLPWSEQEENNLEDASGKSTKVSSPVEEGQPGYLDPPGQLFKQPRSAPLTSKHHSVPSLPCYPSSINQLTSIWTPSSSIQ